MDTELDRPRWRFTGDYLFHPRLNAGIEFNPGASEITFRGNLRVIDETKYNPNVSLGTSSDRIGSPEGTQCYYVTFAKSLPKIPVSPYVSVNYSEWEDGWTFPFGTSIRLSKNFSTMFMNDGRKPHAMLNFDSGRGWGLSAMWVWFERAGASLSFGF